MEIISLKYDFSFKSLFRSEIVRKYFISDALAIPVERIKSVRLANPHLWKRYRKQKLGILDVLVELNDDSKVNIELQIKMMKHWDKRNLFYLAKMFTDDLLMGEDYTRLKRCICISILDFNMDEAPEYHKVYRLRDMNGREFTNMFEIHIIELRKSLTGSGRMDEWIQLFNVETEEELRMIQAKTVNPGIKAAIEEMKVMGFVKNLKVLYEAHMKQVRDRKAEDAYVYDQGVEAGERIGRAEGRAEMETRIQTLMTKMIAAGEADKLSRLTDKVFLKEMYDKYDV